MIYHSHEEPTPGFTLDVIFTNGWSNEAYRSGLSIVRNFYPINNPKSFDEINDSAIIIKRGDDKDDIRMSIIADYNDFDNAKIARCASTIVQKLIAILGDPPSSITVDDLIENTFRAIQAPYMQFIETIIIESNDDNESY